MNAGFDINANESSLVEAARCDADAFAELYRRYLTPVYRYMLCRVDSREEAEDITARVFVEALEGLVAGRYREGGCFSAWLFTIARRHLVDYYRQRKNAGIDEIPPAPSSLPQFVEEKENIQRLRILLAGLNERQRELLRLRFGAGLDFREIALLDGRSEAAVKMAFYRTLDFLRDHWEDADEE